MFLFLLNVVGTLQGTSDEYHNIGFHGELRQMSHLMTKPTKWHTCPVKTQTNLGICLVWSEFSLSTWRKLGSIATHWAHSKDSDQTRQMPRLICLCWEHSHFVGFVVRGFKYQYFLVGKKKCIRNYGLHCLFEDALDLCCPQRTQKKTLVWALAGHTCHKLHFLTHLCKSMFNT